MLPPQRDQARGVPEHAATGAPDDDATPGQQEQLPPGIEPWSGEDMPRGTASSHDLHAPEAAALDPAAMSLPPGRGAPATDEANYRRIYETRFKPLETAQREERAPHVEGSELYALCLDPTPRVIATLLDNPRFGLEHARFVAAHHGTAQGLEILARRAQLLRDSHVQRRLLANLQTPEVVLERIVRQKRLLDLYRLSVDRDLPERNRLRVRARLRPAFASADPEERAALVIKTEGRCLIGLTGCTFDGRTTQILCNQSTFSTLFIQNLARFPATPPPLVAKLLRLPAVQRQPQLRALLSRHGNLSAEARRKG